MKIHKALKVKNRLIGEVNRLREIIRRENSYRNDTTSTVVFQDVANELVITENKLVSIRAAIAEATAPIAGKLSALSFLKDKINFIQSLPTRKGEELVAIGRETEARKYIWNAYIDREAVDKKIAECQDSINKLQDEVDEFNATTEVNFSE